MGGLRCLATDKMLNLRPRNFSTLIEDRQILGRNWPKTVCFCLGEWMRTVLWGWWGSCRDMKVPRLISGIDSKCWTNKHRLSTMLRFQKFFDMKNTFQHFVSRNFVVMINFILGWNSTFASFHECTFYKTIRRPIFGSNFVNIFLLVNIYKVIDLTWISLNTANYFI